MPEAVIVATARTPIGRANKGSLAEARPDDLSAFIIREIIRKSGIDGSLVEDVMWGCAQPAGEAGHNIGRLAGILAVGGHLLAPGGRLLAMKGQHPTEEIAELPAGWRVVGSHPLAVPGLAGERHLVEVARA